MPYLQREPKKRHEHGSPAEFRIFPLIAAGLLIAAVLTHGKVSDFLFLGIIAAFLLEDDLRYPRICFGKRPQVDRPHP